MKNAIRLTVLMVFVLAFLSGCATMPQTWPDQERIGREQDGCHPGEDRGWAEDRRAYA